MTKTTFVGFKMRGVSSNSNSKPEEVKNVDIPIKQQVVVPQNIKMGVFANNASTYYKPHSLSVGIGTVRNYSRKYNRT